MTNNFENIDNYALGTVPGFLAYKYVLPKVNRMVSKLVVSNNFSSITPEENNIFWECANKAYEKSPLYDLVEVDSKIPESRQIKRKAELIHIDNTNFEEKLVEIKGKFRAPAKNSIYKLLKKILSPVNTSKKDFKTNLQIVADGKNAVCYPNATAQSSLILVNKDKMGVSTFHEIGHALNRHSKGVGNLLNKTRSHFALFVPIVFLSALFSPKPDETKENSVTFLNKNCGLISGAFLLPTVAEEGIASIKGAKLAKNMLPKDMYKKLNKLNTRSWMTYALSAIITSLFIQGAVTYKNKVEKPL